MSYIKMSDIDFTNPDHRLVCENLLRDISAAESQMVVDEEMYEQLKATMGEKAACYVASPTMSFNAKMLMALKLAFWYYSGKSPGLILDEELNNPGVDIFNP